MRALVVAVASLGFPGLILHASVPPDDNVHFCAFGDHGQWGSGLPRPAAKGLANLNVGEPRTVRMIYFLPNDRPFRQEVVDSMTVRIREVQSFYAEQMQAHGYGNKTFRFESDAQGEPLVHRVDGQHPDSHYLDLTHIVFEEIGQMFDLHENIYIVFVDHSLLDHIGTGGGTQANGTGSRAQKRDGWVLLPGSRALVPGVIGYGIVAHELGHAFGLLHDFRDGSYIMSYGPTQGIELSAPGWSRLSACAAEFLAVHPYFNTDSSLESDKARLPAIELVSSPSYPAGTVSVPIRLEAAASQGLHQVVLFAASRGGIGGAGGLEIVACRGLSGGSDAVVEFEYDGTIPSSLLASSLSDPVAHPIRVLVVDSEGDVAWTRSVLAEVSPHEIESFGHTDAVNSVAFSPDGATLVSGASDGSTILWDVETGVLAATLDDGVTAVAVSPDGATLASGSRDGAVILRNMETRERTASLEGHAGAVNSVSFSPNGATLASGSRDGTVILWDVVDRGRIAILEGHSGGVTSVSFSPDGATLASGSRDGTTILWDVAARRQIASLDGHADEVTSVSFSPDGATLASGSWDRTVILWDAETREPIATLEEHVSAVSSVSFPSPGGGTLASGSRDGTVILWDLLTTEGIAAFGHTDEVNSVSFSSGGALLAAGGRDGAVLLWDTSEWTLRRPFELEILSGDGQQGAPGAPLAHPLIVEVRDQYGDLLPGATVTFEVTAGDGRLSDRFAVEHTTTDADGRAELILALGPYPGVNAVGVSIRGVELARFTAEGVGSTEIEDDYRTWHLPKGATARLGKGGISRGDRAVAHSADGRYLAVAGAIGVWLYEAASSRPMALLPSESGAHSVAFSLDGTLAAGLGDSQVGLWDLESGKRIRTLSHSGRGRVSSVVFSTDGVYMASASVDEVIDLWDWESLHRVGTWSVDGVGNRPSYVVSSPVAFSPDGTRLVSGFYDGTVRLWDLATQEEVAILRGHTDEVSSVLYSPDGALLASGSGLFADPTIRLWDAAALEEAATLRGHEGGVVSLSFSPDGATLVSGSRDRTVRLWDVATRTSITTLDHTVQVFTVSFSRDGATLVFGAQDGVWLRDMETGNVVELPGHDGPLWGNRVVLSPDGGLLASTSAGSGRYEVRLWDLRSQGLAGTLTGLPDVVTVAFSPDGASLAGGSFIDPAIKLWDVATRRLIGTLEEPRGVPTSVVAFSPVGALLASGARDGTVNLWNVETRELTAALEAHPNRISAISFSPDGSLMATGGFDGPAPVKLWDVVAKTLVTTLEGHLRTIDDVSFSPDGALLATAGREDAVKLWDVAARELIATLEAVENQASLAFSRDGMILAVGQNRQIRLWDVAARRVTSTLEHTASRTTSVMFAPDGRLISGSADGTILLWDLRPRPKTLDKVSGDELEGPAGAAMPQPFVVQIRDQNGNPLEGVAVTFEVTAGGGTLSATTATTDADGLASATLTLGRDPGSNTVTARVSELNPVIFSATGLATPTTAEAISGDEQQGAVGTLMPEPFVVEVRDQNGNPIEGIAVTFEVTAGGGTLSATTATTDADGRAASTLTMGSQLGANTVVTTVAGLDPVTFTATARATPDFDGDGEVAFSDFYLFAEAFGGSDPRFDLDASGVVDFADFFLFAESFGQPARAKLLALARERIGLPDGPQLQQNTPNPFNSQTIISWFLLRPGAARVEVFALTGQRVAVLHQGPGKSGVHHVHWNGRDDEGFPLASGVYLYRLVADETVRTRKLTLLR